MRARCPYCHSTVTVQNDKLIGHKKTRPLKEAGTPCTEGKGLSTDVIRRTNRLKGLRDSLQTSEQYARNLEPAIEKAEAEVARLKGLFQKEGLEKAKLQVSIQEVLASGPVIELPSEG